MLVAIRKLRNLEDPRCEAIHSVINQFVVFEQSAEMNNKYDLGNFAKLLEAFTPQQEMAILDNYLYGTSLELEDPKLAGDVDRSAVDQDSKRTGEDDNSTRDEDPKDAEDLVILPNAFIPVIANKKFEFVPYQTQINAPQFAPVSEGLQQTVARLCEQQML